MAGAFRSLDYEWLMSPASRPRWRAQRAGLTDLARGDVVDLGGPDRQQRRYPHATLVDHIPHAARLPDSPTYDTAVSVLRIGQSADPARLLAATARALRPDGRLLFLEHARTAGLGRRAQRAMSPLWRATAGHHLDRDVPALVRDAGFLITDLERFTMPTWPARTFTRGVARLAGPTVDQQHHDQQHHEEEQ